MGLSKVLSFFQYSDMARILMIAVQALKKRTTELKQKEAQIAALESKVDELEGKLAYFERVAVRLETLEMRTNPSIQLTPEKSLGAGGQLRESKGEQGVACL